MTPHCERLNQIEAALPVINEDDVRWMVTQLRGWQKFGARVVGLEDVIKPGASIVMIRAEYNKLFGAARAAA